MKGKNYVKDFVELFEGLYPSKLSENWDNTGLLLGSSEKEVNRVFLCLDVTPGAIEEAKKIGADLIISHHPFIFKALKKIVDTDTKQKAIIELIKADISVISLHTNLDAAKGGVNEVLARTLGLLNIENVKGHHFDKIYKVCVFVPDTHAEILREKICEAGAGFIGNYSHCTFASLGTGSFMPQLGAKPFNGSLGKLELAQEIKIETVCKEEDLKKVIAAIKMVHPYEEVAYDLYPLEIKDGGYSYAKMGELTTELSMEDFAKYLKKCLGLKNLRLIGKCKQIKKVVVFSGSFDADLDIFRKSGADALVTGDLKYHTALDCVEEGYFIADCGHFGTEIIILKELKSVLEKHFLGLRVEAFDSQEDPFVIY